MKSATSNVQNGNRQGLSAQTAPVPIGPPYKDLQANFSAGLTPRQESYAALIDIADLGRRSVGLAPDQDGAPGDGLELDDEGRISIEPELEDRLVSVSAFEALTPNERAEIWDLLTVPGNFEIQAVAPDTFKRIRIEWSEAANATSYVVYLQRKAEIRVVAVTDDLSAFLDYDPLLTFDEFVESSVFVTARNENAQSVTQPVTLDSSIYFGIRGRATSFNATTNWIRQGVTAMSDDGAVLVSGIANKYENGTVFVHRLGEDNRWTLVQTINTVVPISWGFSLGLGLSGDGKRLVFNRCYVDTRDDSGPEWTGYVDYYEYDEPSNRFVLRQSINAPYSNASFGYSIALNRDGSYLYITFKDSSETTAFVRIYHLDNNIYSQAGQYSGGSSFGQTIACWHGNSVVLAVSDNETVYRFDHRSAVEWSSILLDRVGTDMPRHLSLSLNEEATLLAVGNVGNYYQSAAYVGFDKVEIVDFSAETMTVKQTLEIPALTGNCYGLTVRFASDGSLATLWRSDATHAIVYPSADSPVLSADYRLLAAERPPSFGPVPSEFQYYTGCMATAKAGARVVVNQPWEPSQDPADDRLLLIY